MHILYSIYAFIYPTPKLKLDLYDKYNLQINLGDNTFVIEWFAGINCIILWSQI